MSFRTTVIELLGAINDNLLALVARAEEPRPVSVTEAMDVLLRAGRKSGPIVFTAEERGAIQVPTLDAIGDPDIKAQFAPEPTPEPAPIFEVGDAVWVQKMVGGALVNEPGRPGVVISREIRKTKVAPHDFWTYRVETANDVAVVHYGKPYPPFYEHLTLTARTVEVGDPVLVWSEPGHPLNEELGNAEGVGWIASVNEDGDELAVAWGWHRSFERHPRGAPSEDILRIQRRCSRYGGGSRARIIPRGNHDRAPVAPPLSLLDPSVAKVPWINRWLGDHGELAQRIKDKAEELQPVFDQFGMKRPNYAPGDLIWARLGPSKRMYRSVIRRVGKLFDDGSAISYWVTTPADQYRSEGEETELSTTVISPREEDEGEVIALGTHVWYRLPGTDVELRQNHGHTITLRYRQAEER